jgi:hypothetical protein
MGHRFDRGDVIDMLEESAIRRIPVVVQLRDGRVFEDRVTDIGKWHEEDWVAFAQHDFTPLRSITSCQRAQPPSYSYAGKRDHAGDEAPTRRR